MIIREIVLITSSITFITQILVSDSNSKVSIPSLLYAQEDEFIVDLNCRITYPQTVENNSWSHVSV